MEIKVELTINKAPSAVWEIVGNRFSEAYTWASVINHSAGDGKRLSKEVCEERACDVSGMGRLREKILKFDPEKYVLEYLVTQGMPSFVARGVNRWSLTGSGETTLLSINATIETKGLLGAMMAPMMKLQMTGMMRKMGEELKHFVETGAVHPRKAKALAGAQRKVSVA